MIVPVKLGDSRDYPVYIDEKQSFTELLKNTDSTSFVVVTNDTIAELYSDELSRWREDIPELKTVVLPDGEKYKTMETVMTVLEAMLEAKLDRKTLVIAFGGGVIGDMTGFAASLFLRGVRFVQVPTTLLAMVDSSVGGKTAVNHPMGKNMIGAFYQPIFVWIETRFLDTLQEREFIAGCGEVLKYGFIGGESMFSFVEERFQDVLSRDITAVRDVVRRSIEIKAAVVAEDERENGVRALLNFGHTFGHALEKYYNYSGILHGEGVFWGIRCAIDLGFEAGYIAPEHKERYERAAAQIQYPKLPSKPAVEELFKYMFSDKKTEGGKLRFVVPTGIGESVVASDFSEKEVLSVMSGVFK